MISGKHQLAVFEYGGDPRGGKGTITDHIATHYEGVATEETGADYRAVTKALLLRGTIAPNMGTSVMDERIGRLTSGTLTGLAARRPELVAEHGLASLYEPDVNELVSELSPLPQVRSAVKSGFMQRVASVIARGETQILLVDGRNLAPVVDRVAGADLIMRTFVSCMPVEAAFRETARTCQQQGIDVSSPQGQAIFRTSYEAIQKRNSNDANRPIDPVRPEPDAIDYWWDGEVTELTIHNHALQTRTDYTSAAIDLFQNTEGSNTTSVPRRGAGKLAVLQNRQVLFDTSPYRGAYDDPKGGMLQAAERMFKEAIELTPGLSVSAR